MLSMRLFALLLLLALPAGAFDALFASESLKPIPPPTTLPVDDWGPEHVAGYLESVGLDHETVHAFLTARVDGRMMMHVTPADLREDFSLTLTQRMKLIGQITLVKNTQKTPVPLTDFWSWRTLNRDKADHYCSNLLNLPRTTLLYMALRDPDTLEGLLSSPPHPLRPIEPPQAGLLFWGMLVLCPHVLLGWHGIGFFATNYWVTFIAVSFASAAAVKEVSDIRKQGVVPYALSARNPIFQALLWGLAFYVTPWFLTDLFFFGRFSLMLLASLWGPVGAFWSGQHLSGGLQLLAFGAPLLFDDGDFWDIALYLGLVLPGALVALLGSRVLAGQLTPRVLRWFGPVARLLPPFLWVQTDRLLESSVQQLMAQEREQLGGRMCITYTRKEELGADGMREEGIDAGGLFRDWVSRLAGELFDPANHVVQYSTVAGVHVARLSTQYGMHQSDSCEPAQLHKALGRLLAVGLNNELALSVELSLPLCAALLGAPLPCDALAHAHPAMAAALQAAVSAGDAEAVEQLCLCFEDEHGKPLVQGGCNQEVSLENVKEFLRLRLERAFANEATQTVCEEFRAVPGVRHKLEGLDAAGLQALFRGQEGFSAEEWRAHTDVEPATKQDCAVVQWFWEHMEAAEQCTREEVLCWVCSLRRPPAAGFGGMSRMKLKVLGASEAQLPCAHTCFNTLELPEYGTKERLVSKLAYAVQHTDFGLA